MSDDDYGFEYSDDDQEEEDVNIENRYYNAKGDLADDVDAALSGFQEVVSMEEEKGEWGFKAHKQMVKLEFKRGNYDAMMGVYKTMLTYIKSAVTRNYSEKVLNKILEDLVQIAKCMDALDASDGDDRNAANLQIVLDRIRLYEREHSRIVEARKGTS